MYGYSGPVRYDLAPGPTKPSYAGPLHYAPSNFIGGLPASDYAGPQAIEFLSPGHIVYYRPSQFATFGGSRAAGDTISLAPSDVVSSLGITDSIIHYRYDAYGDFRNTPDTPSMAGYAMGSVSFAGIGLQSNGGVASTGGSASDFVLVDSDSSIAGTTMTAWVRWAAPSGDAYLWGWDYYDDWTGYQTQLMVGWESGQFVVRGAGAYGSWYFAIPAAKLPFVAGQSYFLNVRLGWVNESGVDRATCRVFVDGRLYLDGKTSIYSDYGQVQLSPGQSYVPTILGLGTNDPDAGTRSFRNPFPGSIDEVVWSRWQPTVGSGVQPRMTYDDSGLHDNTSWSSGADQAFSPARYPDPDTSPASSLIFYGPVEDANLGSAAGISSVQLYMDAPTDGQQVFVSVRASDTAFSASSTSVAWGDWWPFTGYADLKRSVGGSTFGRYVQVRIMATPSSDLSAAPTISRIDLWVQNPGRASLSSDLPASASVVGNYVVGDLPGTVHVVGTISSDLPATTALAQALSPSDLACAVNVVFSSSLPAAATIVGRLSSDLSGTVGVLPLVVSVLSSNLPAVANVYKFGFHADLPSEAHVYRRQAYDLPASVAVDAHLLGGSVVVRQPIASTLRASVTLTLDAPGAVQNLRADVPTDQWQSQGLIHFTWDPAIPLRSPVQDYLWYVDRSPTTQVNTNTWNSTTQTTADVDLDNGEYGIGQWYFHVAARATTGYTGPSSVISVWYNHPPTRPGTSYMTVNGQDTVAAVPLLSCDPTSQPLFAFSASADADGTTPTYQIQFASRSDFGLDPESGASSIAKQVEGVSSTSLILTPILKSTQWFWRIRSFDGKQYSEWSPVGSFRFNAPPSAPSGLTVVGL